MKCCFCQGAIETEYSGWDKGHNPAPLKTGAKNRCCSTCNSLVVIPARLAGIGWTEKRKTANEP